MIKRTWNPPPGINDVLTPRACLTLLADTLIRRGNPIRLHPSLFFGTARIVGQFIKSRVKYRSLFHRFALGVSREFKYDRVSVDSSTLYSQCTQIHESRIHFDSQCTQTDYNRAQTKTKQNQHKSGLTLFLCWG